VAVQIVQLRPKAIESDDENLVTQNASLEECVIAALRNVYDPELPVNIHDLGLIYAIDINDSNDVAIAMTLTAPHCPVAESLPAQVQCAVNNIEQTNKVTVELVWDPPWTQERLSDEAKLVLNLY